MSGPTSGPGGRPLGRRVAGRVLGLLEQASMPVVWRVRRALLVGRIRALCVLRASDIELRIAPTSRLGRRLQVEVARGVQGRLEIGERAQVGDGVRLALLGGSITLGADVEFRRGGVVDARGSFVLQGPALVSYGVVVHCAERITVAPGCGIAEYVTLVDSAHFHTDDGTWFLDNVKAAPITIGRAVWIGAKATVLRGVTLGDDCIVSANALVVRDVPAKAVVSGVPAEPVVRRPAGEQS